MKTCKKCKGVIIERGFKENRRYECSKCGFVKISLFSRLFGNYQGYPKEMDKWEGFNDWRVDTK